MKKTPLKRSKLRMKTTSTDPKVREMIKAQVEKREEMYVFFTEFFYSIPQGDRICQSCGKPLADPARTYYFDHLLPKSKYPEYILDPGNIFLCCLECHSLKESGFPTEKHQEAIEKAKERFGLS
jgi:5-methylcytosine-specific restriction endonuclease McrA